MAKKFIFVSTYASPELSSSEYLSLDIMEQCRKAGFDVVRLKPNPVRGLSKHQIKVLKKNTISEESYGICQTFKCFSFKERFFLFRFIRYHFYSKKIRKYIKKNFSDIFGIFIWSYPPIGLSMPICKQAQKYSIPVLFDVHDIQPDILCSRNSVLNKVIKRSVQYVIHNSTHIFTLSQDMKLTLIDKGANANKISVIPPWPYKINIDVVIPLVIEQKIKNKFVVAYIGNIGSFQNINKILEVAILAEQLHYDDILFLFVGDGGLAFKVQDAAKKHKNIAYFHKISEQEAARLYQIVDVNLISLGDKIINYACPSKTPMVLEARKDILAIVNKSLYRDELESLGAYACDPKSNANDILDKIVEIKNNSKHIVKLSNIYQRDECLQKWLTFFQSLFDNSVKH